MLKALRSREIKGRLISKYVAIVLLIVLTVFGSTYIWSWRIRDVPFMGDETMWITGAMYYTELLSESNFDHDDWDAPHLHSAGSLNQPLGKLLLGVGIRYHPQREDSDTKFRGVYNYSQSFEWNRARGNVPDKGLLLRAREVNMVFAALCFVALAIGAVRSSGVSVALFAAALVILNDAIQVSFSWALSDTTYNFFLLAGFCAGVFYASASNRRVAYGLACLCGMLAGAACSVKITGLVVGGMFFILVAAYRASSTPRTTRTELGAAGLFGLCALVIVYAINPYFWPTSSWANLLELPNLYWRQKAAFDAVPVGSTLWPADSSRFVEMHRILFSAFSVSTLEWILFCVGAVYSTYSIVQAIRRSKMNVLAVPFLYFLANYLFILTFMQMNWPRHYLPTVFAVKLVTAVGIVFVLRLLLTGVRRYLLQPFRRKREYLEDKSPSPQ